VRGETDDTYVWRATVSGKKKRIFWINKKGKSSFLEKRELADRRGYRLVTLKRVPPLNYQGGTLRGTHYFQETASRLRKGAPRHLRKRRKKEAKETGGRDRGDPSKNGRGRNCF